VLAREARNVVWWLTYRRGETDKVFHKPEDVRGVAAALDAGVLSPQTPFSAVPDCWSTPAFRAGRTAACKDTCRLLRDIFGNPFGPASPIAEGVLGWSDGLIIKLAEAAYQERELPSGHLDNARLAVLADALTDAGSTDDRLLGHLRSEGPHVRGCFAIDLLTRRE
jgi:hypothetical protein